MCGPKRKPRPAHFGATHFVNASTVDPVQAVREITNGGADFTFEATGQTEIAELCYKATCRAGTTVLIGQPTENAMAGFPPYWIAQDENRVIGSSYGSTRPMIDFPKALRLVKQGFSISNRWSPRSGLSPHQRGDRARRDRRGQPHGAAVRRSEMRGYCV